MIKERILYEDNHLIVVNKMAGEIVQGDKTGDVPLVEKVRAYIKETYEKPGNVFCGLVHRIDRPVSGAVIFAKTSKALTRMNQMVKDRDMDKIYWALVEQTPLKSEDHLIHFLQKNEKLNKSFASKVEKPGMQRAELKYKVVTLTEKYTLLEVTLLTGRHHQIRVQLSQMGCVIKGDVKYGARRANKDQSISLHARKLSFIHPTTKTKIEVLAPPFDPVMRAVLREK